LFVDTNILVYAQQAPGDPRSEQARSIVAALWASARGATSVQVLLELHSVLVRKSRPPLSLEDAWARVMPYVAWHPLPSTTETMTAARGLQRVHGLSLWDAHVLGTASLAGLSWILSEDMAHDTVYGSITVIDPFRATRSQRSSLGLPSD
jgi:predicted nucleic acid-binding protein